MFTNLQSSSLFFAVAVIVNGASLFANPLITSPGSTVGIASYPGENYSKNMNDIYDFLRSIQSPELDQIVQDLDVSCREGKNALNRIEWTTVDNQKVISMGCFQTHEMNVGKAITIRLNEAGQLINATTSNLVIDEDGQLIDEPKPKGVINPADSLIANTNQDSVVKIEQCKKRPALYVTQTIAVVAGGALGGFSAKKALNDGGDKVLHGGFSTGLTMLIGSILHTRFNLSPAKSAAYGAIASCTIGAIKEATDPKFGRVRASTDNKANLIGCAIGFVLTYTLNRYIDENQEKFYKSPSGSGTQCRK